MKIKTPNIIISFALIVSLLLPIGISFLHTLHLHKNKNCIATAEKHIHSKKIDCSSLHYLTSIEYLNHDYSFTPVISVFIHSKLIFTKSFYSLSKNSSFLVRGPPFINVS